MSIRNMLKWRYTLEKKLPEIGKNLFFIKKYSKSDLDSCGNKSRKYIEGIVNKILEYEGIEDEIIEVGNSKTNKNEFVKLKDINLSKKINILKDKGIINKTTRDSMNSIRHIGNTSSHSSKDKITNKNIMDAYEYSCSIGEWFIGRYIRNIKNENENNIISYSIKYYVKSITIIIVFLIFIINICKGYIDNNSLNIQITKLNKTIEKMELEISNLKNDNQSLLKKLNNGDDKIITNSNKSKFETFPTNEIDENIKSSIENLILEFENKTVDATLKGIPEFIKPYIYSKSNFYDEKSKSILNIYNTYDDYLNLEMTNCFIKDIIRINKTDYKVFAEKTTILKGKKKEAVFGDKEEKRVETVYIITEEDNNFYIKSLEKQSTLSTIYS